MEGQGGGTDNIDSIVLEEEIDPNYVPSENEVIEYAKWLGMDLEIDKDLYWIAREGLMAPLPSNWKPCKTKDTEDIYYFNFATGESTWDHPCDGYYKRLYEEEKKKKETQAKANNDAKRQQAKSDIQEILGKKEKKAKKAPKIEAIASAEKKLELNPVLERKPLPLISKSLELKPGSFSSVGGELPKPLEKPKVLNSLSESTISSVPIIQLDRIDFKAEVEENTLNDHDRTKPTNRDITVAPEKKSQQRNFLSHKGLAPSPVVEIENSEQDESADKLLITKLQDENKNLLYKISFNELELKKSKAELESMSGRIEKYRVVEEDLSKCRRELLLKEEEILNLNLSMKTLETEKANLMRRLEDQTIESKKEVLNLRQDSELKVRALELEQKRLDDLLAQKESDISNLRLKMNELSKPVIPSENPLQHTVFNLQLKLDECERQLLNSKLEIQDLDGKNRQLTLSYENISQENKRLIETLEKITVERDLLKQQSFHPDFLSSDERISVSENEKKLKVIIAQKDTELETNCSRLNRITEENLKANDIIQQKEKEILELKSKRVLSEEFEKKCEDMELEITKLNTLLLSEKALAQKLSLQVNTLRDEVGVKSKELEVMNINFKNLMISKDEIAKALAASLDSRNSTDLRSVGKSEDIDQNRNYVLLLQDKEKELLLLKENLNEKTMEISNLQSKLLQAAKVDQAVQDKEKELLLLKESLNEKTMEISNLQSKLLQAAKVDQAVQDKEKELLLLKESLNEKTTEISNLQSKLLQAAKVDQAVQDKEKELLLLKESLNEKTTEISNLQSKLLQTSKADDKKFDVSSSYTLVIEELKEAISDKVGEIATLSQTLLQKDIEIQKNVASINQEVEQNVLLMKDVREKEKLLDEANSKISSLVATIKSGEEITRKLNAQIEQKDAEILQLHRASLEKQAIGMDASLNQFQQNYQSMFEELSAVKNLLQKKDFELLVAKSEIEVSKANILSLEEKLSNLQKEYYSLHEKSQLINSENALLKEKLEFSKSVEQQLKNAASSTVSREVYESLRGEYEILSDKNLKMFNQCESFRQKFEIATMENSNLRNTLEESQVKSIRLSEELLLKEKNVKSFREELLQMQKRLSDANERKHHSISVLTQTEPLDSVDVIKLQVANSNQTDIVENIMEMKTELEERRRETSTLFQLLQKFENKITFSEAQKIVSENQPNHIPVGAVVRNDIDNFKKQNNYETLHDISDELESIVDFELEEFRIWNPSSILDFFDGFDNQFLGIVKSCMNVDMIFKKQLNRNKSDELVLNSDISSSFNSYFRRQKHLLHNLQRLLSYLKAFILKGRKEIERVKSKPLNEKEKASRSTVNLLTTEMNFIIRFTRNFQEFLSRREDMVSKLSRVSSVQNPRIEPHLLSNSIVELKSILSDCHNVKLQLMQEHQKLTEQLNDFHENRVSVTQKNEYNSNPQANKPKATIHNVRKGLTDSSNYLQHYETRQRHSLEEFDKHKRWLDDLLKEINYNPTNQNQVIVPKNPLVNAGNTVNPLAEARELFFL